MSSEQIIKEGGSPLNRLNSEIVKLKKKGKPVIELHVGQPDEKLPEFLVQSANEALENPDIGRYMLVEGDLVVRKSISVLVQQMFDLVYNPERIVITSGAKQGLDAAIYAILTDEVGELKGKNGKKIMIIDSDWPTYASLVKKHGGEVVLVGLDKDFSLPLSEIRKLIDKDVRAIIINSPNNPTGIIYSREELAELAQIATENNIYIISDEVYRALILEGEMCPSICDFPEMKELAIIVNSFSKMWAIPGWRCGFVLAPDEKLCQIMTGYKSECDGNSCSIAQFAMMAAINKHYNESLIFIDMCNKKYKENVRLVCERLDLLKVKYITPKGALYVFAELPKKLGVSSEECANILLRENIAVAPGRIFGKSCDSYIRICIAPKREDIIIALEKIEKITMEDLK